MPRTVRRAAGTTINQPQFLDSCTAKAGLIDEPALTPDGDSEADHDAEPEEPELQPLSFAALDAALESDSVEKTIGNTEYTSDDEISGEEISRSHSYIKEK